MALIRGREKERIILTPKAMYPAMILPEIVAKPLVMTA